MMKAAAEGSMSRCERNHQLRKGGCLEEVVPRPALIRTVDRGRDGAVAGGGEDTVSVPGSGSSMHRDTRVLGCGGLQWREPRRMDLGWSRGQSAKEVG